MRHEEERTIYMIKPGLLLGDVIRALRKLGLNPLLEEKPGGWLLEAAGSGRHVRVLLTSETCRLRGREVFGPVPVSRLRTEAEGPEEFVRELKRRLEVELLRCLG